MKIVNLCPNNSIQEIMVWDDFPALHPVMSNLRLESLGLFESRLRYGIIFWGLVSRSSYNRMYRLKRVLREGSLALGPRDKCRERFRSEKVLTLSGILLYHTSLFKKIINIYYYVLSTTKQILLDVTLSKVYMTFNKSKNNSLQKYVVKTLLHLAQVFECIRSR